QFRDLQKFLYDYEEAPAAVAHQDLVAADLIPSAGPAPAPTELAPMPVSPRPKNDLSDLPPELLAELSDNVKGEQDVIIQIINDRGGVATIDEILIDLYRKHQEIGKRAVISNKLYRLSK